MNVVRPDTLVERTAEVLRQMIHRRDIGPIIPGENRLTPQLGVSRRTVRSALILLEGEGLITPSRQGKSRRVNKTVLSEWDAPVSEYSVGVILPTEHDALSSGAQQLFHEFESAMRTASVGVSYHHPQIYQTGHPGHRLDVLLSEFHVDLWLAYMPPLPVADYFVEKGVPALLCGGPAGQSGLSYCAFDGIATLRHAIGVLTRVNHTRICFANRSKRPGHLQAFREEMAVRNLPYTESMNTLVWEYDSDLLYRKLIKLLTARERPTAVILNGTDALITLYSALNHLRMRVPEDLSVLVTGSDPLYGHFHPRLTYYSTPHHRIATSLAKQALKQLKHPGMDPESVLLLMEYVKGESVAPPRGDRA